MRKGITPIISVVILLLITIALAGAAWTFLQGVLLTQISQAFSVPTGGVFCSGGKITVTVVNLGSSTLTGTDFVVASMADPDGNPVVISAVAGLSLRPGAAGKAIEYSCPTTGCTSGIYQIQLGTASNVQQLTAACA